jgi:hypothetical protein
MIIVTISISWLPNLSLGLSVLEEVLELVHPTRLVLIRGQPLSLIDKIYCLYIHKHGPM